MRALVVGGGLGGAATAARLAKLGHTVTVAERLDRLGGAVGFHEQDGYRWDTGPASTALPAALRDLFRKSGRPLERELDLVPVEPMREHRFGDGTVVAMPSGSRVAQRQAVDEGLGAPLGQQWLDYTRGFADTWGTLRREYLERPYSVSHADKETRKLLNTRNTMARSVNKAFRDERLRTLATSQVVLEGHDPRKVPFWVGMTSYVEQNFGVWTIPEGMGALADALTRRLEQRNVEIRLDTTVTDLALRGGRVIGAATDRGLLEADVVVCAIDPRHLPALSGYVRNSMPAIPPTVCHLGLQGEVPDLPKEVVLHGEPMIVVRTGGSARDGGHAWTLLGRGRVAEDIVTALARYGIDVRHNVEVRVDRSPRELVETWGGSPYGVLWQGRATLAHRLGTRTPLDNVFCAGAHTAPGAGVPFVALSAALVAEAVGKA